ncbi:cytosolic 5'-nucleotidase 1A-like isoform X1 [Lates japonicus]|uniref:Cytosolic 5'-nucleotidase 1A-like isoform X1 n=1 Tax=Lates japonicus TaxID=270547 RepID=A0AAD3RF41_LATJO|nr:cytosolic 5'-nucleotidase 1A-like isoform X1 [Lates japonicus]
MQSPSLRSSPSPFNMEKEQIYEQQGMEDYIKYQVEHEAEPLAPDQPSLSRYSSSQLQKFTPEKMTEVSETSYKVAFGW